MPIVSGGGGGGSQPFTPTDLNGLALWLDASTLALADDDPVATWPDASDSGFDATQADPDFQPVCKTAVMNGLRVVRFDQVDFVKNLGLSGAGLGLFRNIEACTIAAVVGNGSSNTNSNYVLCASVEADNTLRRVGLESHNDGVQTIAGSNDDGGGDGDTATGKCFLSGAHPTLAVVASIDWAMSGAVSEPTMPQSGVAADFASTPGPTPDSASLAILVGAFSDASAGSECDYAEILVYQRALNATERRQLLEYLSSKWATL